MTLLSLFRKPTLETLLDRLGGTAPHAAPRPDRFVFDVTHRVQVWYDTGHAVPSRFGSLIAYRAITMTGQLFWFVHDPERGDRFHALTDDPFDAMTLARQAWDDARSACAAAEELSQLAQELRRGTRRMQITIDDARATPMSPLGFRAVLDRAGMFGLTHVSGRTLVRLMKREPQLAYVLYAAWRRERAVPADRVTRSRAAASGFEAMC